MKTILVTGANGYIGRHVVSELCRANVEVVTLDTSEQAIDEKVRHVSASVLSPGFRLSDHFESVPDVCVHLAWRNGFKHNDSSHICDLSGHYGFLEGLIESGVPQVAVMGSMHEVGYWEGAISEETPCNPQSMYGVAKDALRRALFLRAEGTQTIVQWLRGFYIFGDDLGSQSIFGKILRAAASWEKTFPFTSGVNKYDFISVDELARQISACALQDEVAGVINCCSGRPVSLADQVEWFIKQNGLSLSLEYGAYPDRPYDSPGVWGDAKKINRILHRQ